MRGGTIPFNIQPPPSPPDVDDVHFSVVFQKQYYTLTPYKYLCMSFKKLKPIRNTYRWDQFMKGLQIMKTRMISPATHIHVLGNPSDNLVQGRSGGGGDIKWNGPSWPACILKGRLWWILASHISPNSAWGWSLHYRTQFMHQQSKYL